MLKKWIASFILLLMVFGLFADILELKSGAILTGSITGYDKECIYLKMESGEQILVDKKLVKSISSELYTNTLLNSKKSTYPRDYDKYKKPRDTRIFLKSVVSDTALVINRLDSLKVAYLPYDESYLRGIRDATYSKDSNYFIAGGILSGMLLGPIGTGFSALTVGGSIPGDIPPDCNQNAYVDGYYKQSKSDNMKAVLTGGLMGTAIIVAIAVSIASQKSK